MDTTKDRYTGRPDLPQHTRRATPGQDRRRSVWIILAVVAAAMALGAVLSFSGPDTEEAQRPVSSSITTGTGTEAPAMPAPEQ